MVRQKLAGLHSSTHLKRRNIDRKGDLNRKDVKHKGKDQDWTLTPGKGTWNVETLPVKPGLKFSHPPSSIPNIYLTGGSDAKIF